MAVVTCVCCGDILLDDEFIIYQYHENGVFGSCRKCYEVVYPTNQT